MPRVTTTFEACQRRHVLPSWRNRPCVTRVSSSRAGAVNVFGFFGSVRAGSPLLNRFAGDLHGPELVETDVSAPGTADTSRECRLRSARSRSVALGQ